MSKRLVLFSQPSPSVFEKLKAGLFPDFLTKKIFAYMPSDGSMQKANATYTPAWKHFAESNNIKFTLVDNSKRGEDAYLEGQKILNSDILLISGGNTFTLLNHLRQSGLDKIIRDFWNKSEIVLAGFSAGAIILTPCIDIASQPLGNNDLMDENLVGLRDLKGLGIADFEVWPHYYPQLNQQTLENYQQSSPNVIKTLEDDEVMIIEK